MSLFEKLEQKKALRQQAEKDKEESKQKETVEEIAGRLAAAQEKKRRIEELTAALEKGYIGTSANLESFKGQKEKLRMAYEENKDILAEENINDFESMLKANANEPEVYQYHQAGGRGPARESGASGSTGKLYEGVKNISELKDALQAEMPELKLDFRGGQEGEDISRREFAFAQIENYLHDLDLKINALAKEKEEAYLRTPAGKREAVLKVKNVNYVLSNVSLKQVDNFYFDEEFFKVGEKVGLEAIEDVYSEALTKRLQEEAWRRKDGNGRKSQEQEQIDAYADLKRLYELNYDRETFREFQRQHQEALDHLEKIFQDEKIRSAVSHYGISGAPGRDEKYRGWSEERIRADRYLEHLAEISYISPNVFNSVTMGDYNFLAEQFRQSTGDRWKQSLASNSRVLSPEFFKASFQNYQRFFEYIKTKVDADTKLVSDDPQHDSESLIGRFKNDRAFRKEIGLVSKGDKAWPEETYVPVPHEFINRNGGFDAAWEKTKVAGTKWEEEKRAIADLSQAAVESRWVSSWSNYYNRKNETVLKRIDGDQKLKESIKVNLAKSPLFLNPEFGNRKVRLEVGGYAPDRVIKDVTSDEDFRRISTERQRIQKEIDDYVKEQQELIDQKIGSLRRSFIALGRADKIDSLSRHRDCLDDCRKNQKVNWELAGRYMDPEELAKVKALKEKLEENDKEYRQHDKSRLDFLGISDSRNFYLELDPKDPLVGQDMSIKELAEQLRQRSVELEKSLSNLSPAEQDILTERDRLTAEVESTKKRFQETAVRNAGIVRGN